MIISMRMAAVWYIELDDFMVAYFKDDGHSWLLRKYAHLEYFIFIGV